MSKPSFPGLTSASAAATADDVAFYTDGYDDIVVNGIIAAPGPNEILGQKPSLCRFCS